MESDWRKYHARWEGRHWLDRAIEHWAFHAKFHARILEHLQPGDALLDVGSGKGYSAFFFASRGFRVTGIDIDARSVEEATAWAARLDLPARFLQADVFDWKPPERYRLAYSMGLIEHYEGESQRRFLRSQGEAAEFVAALAPTPHSRRTVAWCPVPQTYLRLPALRRIFREAGLDIVSSFGAGEVWTRRDAVIKDLLPHAALHLLQNRFSYAMGVCVVGRIP